LTTQNQDDFAAHGFDVAQALRIIDVTFLSEHPVHPAAGIIHRGYNLRGGYG
jgi:hypothetical protein